MNYEYIVLIYFGIIGLFVGSFMNVVIYRLKVDKTILDASRSACPNCNCLIRWYENIPIFSYLFLRGKCSNCKAGISIQYPIVEFIGLCIGLGAGWFLNI